MSNLSSSQTEHRCKACGNNHPLHYWLYANGSKHLVYQCPVTKQHFLLKFRANLPIPTLKSKKLARQEQGEKQVQLF